MKLMSSLLSLLMLVSVALIADDSKCGCNKPRPTPTKPAPTKEMPRPTPTVKAEADQPEDGERDPEEVRA